MAHKDTGKRKATGLLGELAAVADRLFSAGFQTQCGALCHRHNPVTGALEVLLVTSRESGRWIIPKGWPVKGKTLCRSAEIEALEEAGVRGKARKKPFGYFTYLKERDDGSLAPCTVEVHLVETRGIVTSFREKGQRRIEWMSCAEAARRVREPELKGLLLGAERKLRKRTDPAG
ncbi:NUDIX hydrolase [Rhizobiaceae bacterium BDR2-2]|uniref:NUDIX hydrolase n=1 Tax=Ectorhizobium quercum TaxID=2965071 RepID=A0AAE3SV88_9HYPH|nr:NUDIX hydrolase [Ectorhizobium quercum]MCX8998075.1 NUDIX hydrolase [Ectorhizobium quercum]